jgi:hypothetical protein
VIFINADAGNLVGLVLFGMMGMHSTTDIATAFRKGVASTSFTCLTVGCINWPIANSAMWGPGPFARAGYARGPEVCAISGPWNRHGQ